MPSITPIRFSAMCRGWLTALAVLTGTNAWGQTVLQFQITTGDDSLRGGNSAYATIIQRDGSRTSARRLVAPFGASSTDNVTDADIDDVIWNLNATPRKCLGYRTPIEAFAANLGVALEK
jgi:hypothetical protein